MTAPTDTIQLSADEVEARCADFKSRDVKKVVLTLRAEPGDDAAPEPMEGELFAASSVGLMFRKRGRQDADLYQYQQIGNIEELASKPKQLRAKTLAPVKVDTAREHLVDRHGYQIAQINDMTPKAAFEFHSTLDHTQLGHNHSTGSQADAPTEAPATTG